jgi:hypothetical protein
MSTWRAIIVCDARGTRRYDVTETGKLVAKFPRHPARRREQMWLDLAGDHSHNISQSSGDLAGFGNEQSPPMPIEKIWASLGDTETWF